MTLLSKAFRILELIELKGYTALIVGGAVRDLLLDKEPHDIDIATNMPMDEIHDLFKCYSIGNSKDFGLIGIEFGGSRFEIANFRTEGIYSDSRHPDEIELTSTFEEDCQRRDLTINALAMDKNKKIIDFVNGVDDIRNKTIRFVGDTHERIKEDPIRILRAIRFSCLLGFKMDIKCVSEITLNTHLIKNISIERVFQELVKMASSNKFHECISMMSNLGILGEILPEIEIMNKFKHNKENHPEGDVFKHTLAVLKYVNSDDPLVNLSCLFHDVGKISTQTITDDGKIQYLQHEKTGIDIFNNIAERLKIDNNTKNCIEFVISNHMRFHVLPNMNNSKIINLLNNKWWEILLKISKADEFSRCLNGELLNKSKIHWEKVTDKINQCQLKKDELDNRPYLTTDVISGNEIMEILKIKPGKMIGLVKNVINNMFFNGEVRLNDINNELIINIFNKIQQMEEKK